MLLSVWDKGLFLINEMPISTFSDEEIEGFQKRGCYLHYSQSPEVFSIHENDDNERYLTENGYTRVGKGECISQPFRVSFEDALGEEENSWRERFIYLAQNCNMEYDLEIQAQDEEAMIVFLDKQSKDRSIRYALYYIKNDYSNLLSWSWLPKHLAQTVRDLKQKLQAQVAWTVLPNFT